MRALARLLPVLLLVGVAAAAEDPPTLLLSVGEETEDLGVAVRCDDLSVVAVKASGRGVRGVRPGTTICSFDRSGGGGIRRVYRIVVRAPPAPDRKGAGGGGADDAETPKG